MKKLVFGLLLSGTAVMAQEKEPSTLPETKIQSGRLPVKFSETERSITIIPSEEIKKMPAVTLQDILGYVQSVDLRERGVGGVQADLSFRGGTFDQVLVLIDGVKLSDPQTGHHALNLPIHPSDIERIEILRGPGSRIFGQNAFAGAINIITSKNYDKAARIEIQAGEFGYLQAMAGAQFKTKNSGHRLTLTRGQSNGYEDNRDFIINQLWYQNRISLGKLSEMTVQTGLQQKNFGAMYYYTSPSRGYREYEETALGFINVGGKFARLKNLSVNLNGRWHSDEFRLWRDTLHKGINEHITRTYSLDFNGYHESFLGTTSLGGEFRLENINSSNLGIRERQIAGLFAEHRFRKYKNFTSVIGTNLSYISGFGWVLYPGAEVGYAITPKINLNGVIGRSYRVPTFTDLYYIDAAPSSIGNPALKPESAITWEAGARYLDSHWVAELTWFQRYAESLIDWQRVLPTDPWRAVNVSNALNQGVEASINYKFHLKNLSVLESVRIGYTYLDARGFSSSLLSRYVYDHLRHQVVAGIQLRYTPWLSHSVYYRYQERVSQTEAYSLLDTRLSARFKNWGVMVQVDNILNTDYYSIVNVKMPKRWVRAGVQLQF